MDAIEVASITKVYHSAAENPVKALGGVSFKVPPGKIYGLLGPNGAGKTTMVKILTTMAKPDSGYARIHGFDVTQDPLEVRRRIAVVLQQVAVDGMLSVKDNLWTYAYLQGLSSKEAGERIAPILEEFELEGKMNEMAQDLSLGTKRRLQVAKIFISNAQVLFLDECTTGMDPFMRRKILERIRSQARSGKTVLLTTQVLSEAEELCDHIIIIHRGHTLAAGTMRELRRLSHQTFRVQLTFQRSGADAGALLKGLGAAEFKTEGDQVEMLIKGEEASLLDKLSAISRQEPIRHFEVRGASLEDIFVELVGKT